MRALLVVNPNATATTPRTRDVIAGALGSELKLDVVETANRGHASELAAQARLDGFDLVVALGGDGTVNEVLDGLLGDGDDAATTGSDALSVPRLAVVPGGSANVFARALGLPQEPIEATAVILERLRDGRDRAVGLGRLESGGPEQLGRWFTFCAGFGFDAEIVREVEARRESGAKSTPGLYLRTGLAHYLLHTNRRTPAITAESAGMEPTPVFMVIVANTSPWTYFGQRPLAPLPEASFDTGLDLFALRRLGIVGTSRRLAGLMAGGAPPRGRNVVALHDLDALTLRGEHPLAAQVDGEYLGEFTELRVRSVPAAVTVVA
jgi:diacylglycerol kinase family enzyme